MFLFIAPSSSHHAEKVLWRSEIRATSTCSTISRSLLSPLHRLLSAVTHCSIPSLSFSFPFIRFSFLTPFFTVSILSLSLCISLVAPPLYLQMTSGLRRLGWDWSPVPGGAVSLPVAFVHLPFLLSLAGPALPPSAPHCVPCWALEMAGWGVWGFWLGWLGLGGQWLGWVAQLKYETLLMAANVHILKGIIDGNVL